MAIWTRSSFAHRDLAIPLDGRQRPGRHASSSTRRVLLSAASIGVLLFAAEAGAQICEREDYVRIGECDIAARDATGCCPPEAARARPASSPRARVAAPCPAGRVRAGMQCCWPGQQVRRGVCAGAPRRCPEGWSAREREGHPGEQQCMPGERRGGPMALIPAGRTADGRAAVFSDFYMDVTPVTVGDFAACVRADACRPPNGEFCNYGGGASRHPIDCVPFDQAKAYCTWAGKRLPSADEWELAARGTQDARPYPWGFEEPDDRRAYWGRTCGRPPCTAPVGRHPAGASPHGLLDMAGNVWEWTSTFERDGHREIRGGSWASIGAGLGSTRRGSHYSRRDQQYNHIGFRCAADLAPPVQQAQPAPAQELAGRALRGALSHLVSAEVSVQLAAGEELAVGSCEAPLRSGTIALRAPDGSEARATRHPCERVGARFTYHAQVTGTYGVRLQCAAARCDDTTDSGGLDGIGWEIRSPEPERWSVPHVPGQEVAVHLEAGDELVAGTCGLEGARHTRDTTLALRGPDQRQVAFNDDGCGGLGSHLTHRTGPAGVYHLVMSCYGSSSDCGGTLAWEIRRSAATPPPVAGPRGPVGERRLVDFRNQGRAYAAVVTGAFDDDTFSVMYADGDTERVRRSALYPEEITVGTRVEARIRAWSRFRTGRVTRRVGHAVYVAFHDGEQRWTSIGLVRVPVAALSRTAQIAPDPEATAPTGLGARVLANSRGEGWYSPAVVQEDRGDRLHVIYADGDSETLPAVWVRPDTIGTGTRVQVRPRDDEAAVEGSVVRRVGHAIEIRLADGTYAWVALADVRTRAPVTVQVGGARRGRLPRGL